MDYLKFFHRIHEMGGRYRYGVEIKNEKTGDIQHLFGGSTVKSERRATEIMDMLKKYMMPDEHIISFRWVEK